MGKRTCEMKAFLLGRSPSKTEVWKRLLGSIAIPRMSSSCHRARQASSAKPTHHHSVVDNSDQSASQTPQPEDFMMSSHLIALGPVQCCFHCSRLLFITSLRVLSFVPKSLSLTVNFNFSPMAKSAILNLTISSDAFE